MPQDVPLANRIECEAYGAKVTLVNGLISACARIVSERKEQEGWFDFSTLKEPYRVEGKKTMAYELFEQLGGRLPDAVIFPSGGGVGIIGMWKAFEEMEQLGWIQTERPRLIAVQAEGCAPIVKAWNEAKPTVEMWNNASTIAAGLRVPKPYGDYLVLDTLKRSRGTAVAVSDDEIKSAFHQWARTEGIFAAPEGAASLAAQTTLQRISFRERQRRPLQHRHRAEVSRRAEPEEDSGDAPHRWHHWALLNRGLGICQGWRFRAPATVTEIQLVPDSKHGAGRSIHRESRCVHRPDDVDQFVSCLVVLI
jgi:threonine synthase